MNDKFHGGIRRAGQLPRTLIGVNGVRLINIPGVYYPPHMLTEKTQRERHLPVILSKPPAWAISSRQAAEILGCTPLTRVSPQLVASADALATLRVSRNSLSRFVKQGLLQRFRLRVRVAEGPRLRYYYLRDEVEELDHHRRASSLKR